MKRYAGGRPLAGRRAVAVCLALTLALGLVLGAGLSGCRRGAQGGATEKPAVKEAWVVVKTDSPVGPETRLAIQDTAGQASLLVGSGPFDFFATLAAAPAEGWFAANIKVDGPAPDVAYAAGDAIKYQFPAGPVGEKIVVTLTSVIPPSGQGDCLAVTLERTEPATATLKVKRDGAWQDVSDNEVLTGKPLELLLSFSCPMDQASVAAALGATGLGAGGAWSGPQDFSFSVADPPTVLKIDLTGTRDARGLPLANTGTPWEIYTGDPPRLYCLEPGVSPERPVVTLMADVCAAQVSPDGSTLLVEAYKHRTGDIGAWLADLNAETRRALSGSAYYPGWVDGSNLLLFEWNGSAFDYRGLTTSGQVRWRGTLPKGFGHYSLSPDGKKLAGYVPRPTPDDEGYLVSQDLVIVDLVAGSSQEYKDFVRVYSPPNEGVALGGPAWSPDGTKVAAVTDKKAGQGSAIRIIELSTGQVTEEVPLSDLEQGAWNFFSWSPRGDYWIAGEKVIATGAPYLVRGAKARGEGEPVWSPDGEWFARSASFDGWGETSLYRIDAILGPVEEIKLGPVFPCGFDSAGRFYFIRWPGYQERFQPEWG